MTTHTSKVNLKATMATKTKRRWLRRWSLDRAPRPFVAFAATSSKQAFRLYRAQHLIWVWLGIAAIISAVIYFARPHLGPAIITSSRLFDDTRYVLFSLGGILIIYGVWTIRRALEVMGHTFFTTAAIMNTVAILTLHAITGAGVVQAILLIGLAFTSAYRAYFIVRWIGSDASTS